MAAHARSVIRSARPARGLSSRSSERCANTARNVASRRSASAGAKRRQWRSNCHSAAGMLPLDSWLLFCLACVALVATPGPNVLYLLSRTLAQGRAAGFVSLAGTSTGVAAHAFAAAFGLSALIAAVPLAYDIVRCAGALYLGWLAWTTWRSRGDAAVDVSATEIGAGRLFRQG